MGEDHQAAETAAAPPEAWDPASITAILNSPDNSRVQLDQVFALVYGELKPVARQLLAPFTLASFCATSGAVPPIRLPPSRLSVGCGGPP